MTNRLTRRAALGGLAGTMVLAAPGLALAQSRRNTSSFSMQDWRDHFDTLGKATLVADTASRALHFWSADGSDYRIYPTSVPISEELTKRGYTSIVRKKVGPSWTPTASQMERYPDWKPIPPGPENPLGNRVIGSVILDTSQEPAGIEDSVGIKPVFDALHYRQAVWVVSPHLDLGLCCDGALFHNR